MIVRQMAESECREFLERSSIGRLGCSLDEQPYIVPVYLAHEADNVYVFSTFGQKIRWMRANPKVCIQIDEIIDDSEWTSVIASGRYQELPRATIRDRVRTRAQPSGEVIPLVVERIGRTSNGSERQLDCAAFLPVSH